jgi:hypothetical protein
VSLKIALVLRDWIPDVIRGVEPFVSSEEIRKGKRWPLELANALEELRYGIICLTPTNVNSPWINFEAGALSGPSGKFRSVPAGGRNSSGRQIAA